MAAAERSGILTARTQGGAMPTCAETDEAETCWTVEYWLSHCEGYAVFTSEGPIGYVEEVVESPEGEPSALVVRVGERFSHRVTIPVAEIEGFDPSAERVFVGPLGTRESADDDPAPVRQLRIPAVV
jgi:hypothetical protein